MYQCSYDTHLLCFYLIERCVRHDLIAEVGNFFSPGYPVPYENNTMCTWHIVMLDRSWDTSYYLLKLQVQIDSIEAHPNCAHDAIQVRINH